jgi:hypothetical protein
LGHVRKLPAASQDFHRKHTKQLNHIRFITCFL